MGMIHAPIHNATRSPVHSPFGFGGGLTLPKSGLLFYSKTANGTGGNTGKFVLPTSCYAALGTGFWFSDSSTPIAKTGAEIAAWNGVNLYHVLYSASKGLAVYDPYIQYAILIKAAKTLKISEYPRQLNLWAAGALVEPYYNYCFGDGGVHEYTI